MVRYVHEKRQCFCSVWWSSVAFMKARMMPYLKSWQASSRFQMSNTRTIRTLLMVSLPRMSWLFILKVFQESSRRCMTQQQVCWCSLMGVRKRCCWTMCPYCQVPSRCGCRVVSWRGRMVIPFTILPSWMSTIVDAVVLKTHFKRWHSVVGTSTSVSPTATMACTTWALPCEVASC